MHASFRMKMIWVFLWFRVFFMHFSSRAVLLKRGKSALSPIWYLNHLTRGLSSHMKPIITEFWNAWGLQARSCMRSHTYINVLAASVAASPSTRAIIRSTCVCLGVHLACEPFSFPLHFLSSSYSMLLSVEVFMLPFGPKGKWLV